MSPKGDDARNDKENLIDLETCPQMMANIVEKVDIPFHRDHGKMKLTEG